MPNALISSSSVTFSHKRNGVGVCGVAESSTVNWIWHVCFVSSRGESCCTANVSMWPAHHMILYKTIGVSIELFHLLSRTHSTR